MDTNSSHYPSCTAVNTGLSAKENVSNKVTTLNNSTSNYPSCSAVKAVTDIKANSSALTSHTIDTNNPHGVTANQLGITYSKESDGAWAHSGGGVAVGTARYVKWGKVCCIDIPNVPATSASSNGRVMGMPSQLYPDDIIYTFGTVDGVLRAVSINTNGDVTFGTPEITKNQIIRLHVCYLKQ